MLALQSAGCGFQLRSTDITAIEGVQLSGAATAPSAYRSLRNMLDDQGVTTTSDRLDAFRISLLDERTSRRSVATTSLIDAAEYELRYEVDVVMGRGDQNITDTLVEQRVYSVDALNLSGSTEEQRLLMQEMREAMTLQLVRRIEVLTRMP